MKLLHTLPLALAVLSSSGVLAGPAADALGTCLSENTTGKERKELARWMFVAMSSHPEIKQLSATTPNDLDQVSRATGALFTKLLTETCVTQTRAAVRTEGAQSIQAAFSVLGQAAMQELMSDPAVRAAIGAFERHLDTKKVEAVLTAQ
jgi:hypothetical protein